MRFQVFFTLTTFFTLSISQDNSSEVFTIDEDIVTETINDTTTTIETIEEITEEPEVKVIDYTDIKFNEDCLEVHNKFRALHGAQPLKIDTKIIKFAQERAKTLARQNDTEYLRHNPQNYGENLAAWPLFGQINCSEITQLWFDEYKYVNWSNPETFTPYTYHFTQIVWSSTSVIGCGMASLEGSDWLFICCNYDPPGNYLNEFEINVKPPINESINEVQNIDKIGKNCKCTCEL